MEGIQNFVGTTKEQLKSKNKECTEGIQNFVGSTKEHLKNIVKASTLVYLIKDLRQGNNNQKTISYYKQDIHL